MQVALDSTLLGVASTSALHTLPKDYDGMLIPVAAHRDIAPFKSTCHAAAATPRQAYAAPFTERAELMSVAGPAHLQWDVVPKL